jgi:hypothetical protein
MGHGSTVIIDEKIELSARRSRYFQQFWIVHNFMIATLSSTVLCHCTSYVFIFKFVQALKCMNTERGWNFSEGKKFSFLFGLKNLNNALAERTFTKFWFYPTRNRLTAVFQQHGAVRRDLLRRIRGSREIHAISRTNQSRLNSIGNMPSDLFQRPSRKLCKNLS